MTTSAPEAMVWPPGATATAPCRADIDADSSAVLVFDDGARIPCDRFIMRSFCGVIRQLLEDPGMAFPEDDRGRTAVPIPGQPSAPFWTAVDLLHGVQGVWALPLVDVLGAMECMRYLGSGVHDSGLDARLWSLIRDDSLDAMLPHAPRLLRNPAMAGIVLRVLIQRAPLWHDFLARVLRYLEPHADTILVNAIVAYAPNFFPPPLVVDWALGACPHITQDTALRLCSQHSVMYHPGDCPAVLRRLVELSDARRWPGWFGALLRSVVTSMDKYDVVPLSASAAHGTVIKFHDIPMASVCLTLDGGKLPRSVRLAPWLRVGFGRDGRVEAVFKPRKIDELSRECTALQLRVMAFDDKRDPASGACAEAWFLYEGINPHVHANEYSLAHATATLGDAAAVARVVGSRSGRTLRLDFFFGEHNVLHNPFDPTSATKSTALFLLGSSIP
jgi:hypothetical protein